METNKHAPAAMVEPKYMGVVTAAIPPERPYDELFAFANPVAIIINNYHHDAPPKRAKNTQGLATPTTEEFASFSVRKQRRILRRMKAEVKRLHLEIHQLRQSRHR